MLAQQWQTANSPVLNSSDLNRLNSVVLNAWLQAGATVLQGYVDALKSASETAQQRAPQATAQRIVVE
jgi:hypothetical protein